jgi:ribonuclease-3
MPAPEALERKLGHAFANPALLNQALTHRSFGTPHNERLEFLGDSILNCAVARLIFDRFPDMPEGDLSRLRANLVNQAVLADIAARLELGSLLRLGEGEVKSGGAARPSILADAVEALLGAIFLDAGFDQAKVVVESLFADRLGETQMSAPAKDAKTTLQEWLQGRHLDLPRYSVARIEGEAHRQTFHVQCLIDSLKISVTGSGTSRRAAEQDAAARAYLDLPVESPKK